MMTNWHIVGHEWAIELLSRTIERGKDAHAYLITGPESIGKSLLALRLAQTLNCDEKDNAPCLQCRSCQRIARSNHPDVRIANMETQAAQATSVQATRQKDLKIATIREWQHDIALKPFEGRRRVFILHDAERLNEESSNAMLKTLEEPPPYATIILVAHSHNLLATIVSRCQTIRLRPLPRPQVAESLVATYGLEPSQAHLIAAWSGGRIGWAYDMAQSPEHVALYQEHVDILLALQTQSWGDASLWAEERTKEYRAGKQDEVIHWLTMWHNWWHDVLLVAAGCPEYVMHIDRLQELSQFAHHHTLRDIYEFVGRISNAITHLRENVNPQLALENLFLHLPR